MPLSQSWPRRHDEGAVSAFGASPASLVELFGPLLDDSATSSSWPCFFSPQQSRSHWSFTSVETSREKRDVGSQALQRDNRISYLIYDNWENTVLFELEPAKFEPGSWSKRTPSFRVSRRKLISAGAPKGNSWKRIDKRWKGMERESLDIQGKIHHDGWHG